MPVVRHRDVSTRSFPLWLASRAVLRPMLSLWPLNKQGMAGLHLIDKIIAQGSKPAGVVREMTTLAGCRAERITPIDPVGRDTDTAVLYLHGGGFVVGGVGTHRSVAARLAQAIAMPVYSLEYRQLPAVGVGTSVSDTVDAYAELLTELGYSRVVVAGDSAGGYLAGKVAELAGGRGLDAPAAFIAFSPLLDLDIGTNPQRSSRSDAYIPKSRMSSLAPYLDQGPQPLRGKRSLLDVDPKRFGPTVIITAENELLEPDAIEFAEALHAVGVPVELHSFSWQIHVFPMLAAGHPETLKAIEFAAAFINRALGRPEATGELTDTDRDPDTDSGPDTGGQQVG